MRKINETIYNRKFIIGKVNIFKSKNQYYSSSDSSLIDLVKCEFCYINFE